MPQSSKTEFIPALSFPWLTPYYDAVVRTTTRERTFKKALIRQAGFKAGQQVLDLASGTGTLAIWVKESQPLATVTGVDGDPAILAIATRKAQKANIAVQFDHAFSHNLPYPAAHFDRVVSSLFFHHLTWENKQRTAQELFRVLKSDAELHIADWGYPTNALMRVLFLSIQLLDGFDNTQDNVSGKLASYSSRLGFRRLRSGRPSAPSTAQCPYTVQSNTAKNEL